MILIGSGETGAVYSIGHGRVIKLFHEDKYIDEEYKACKYIGDQTHFAPQVFEKVEVNGKKGYEMQEYVGELLLDLTENIQELAYYAELMGKTHRALHDYPTDHLNLPNLKDMMANHMRRLKHFNEDDKVWLLSVLETLPNGHSLLHGDFMPYNLMYMDDKLSVLDWSDAMLGPAEADIARSLYFILDPTDYEDASYTVHKNKFIEAYLYGYYGNKTTMGIIRKWLLINAVFELDVMKSKGIDNEFSTRLGDYISNNKEKLGSDSLF